MNSRRTLRALLALALLAGCDFHRARADLEAMANFIAQTERRKADAQDIREDPIIEAAFHANTEAVRRMLAQSPDSVLRHVQARDVAGMTALHRAAWAGSAEIATMLVDAGATVDARDGSGVTPFGLAARWGNRAVLDVLLERGADVGHRDDLGKTVLHLAAQYDHAEVCEALIAHGLSPNERDNAGNTPLHSAALLARRRSTTVLLNHGANPNARGYLGWTPLHVAASGAVAKDGADPELCRLLVSRGADVNARTAEGVTPIFHAATQQDSAVVATLLDLGADPRIAQQDGSTVLRAAVLGGSPTVLKMLLDRRTNANERTANMHGALIHLAVDAKSPEMVRLLIDHGAIIQATDQDGRTPLFQAAQMGQTEIVALLLKRGARVDTPDRFRRTPLHVAAAGGYLECARLLVNAGAPLEVRDESGETPMKVAWGPDRAPMRDLLKRHGARR